MKEPPKKSTAREVVEMGAEGVLGAIPGAGSPVAAAFALAIGYAYNRRMQTWFDEVAAAITELQEHAGWPPLDDLVEDDEFLDAVATATRAAQATHLQEKLRALRNGVLHAVGPDAPTVDEQARFFRLIEQFTPSHLRLLSFLHDPVESFEQASVPRPDVYMGGRSHLLDQLPEFAAGRDWYDLLYSDLLSAALTTGGGLHSTQTGASLWQSATSPLGKRFLAFIADPADTPPNA